MTLRKIALGAAALAAVILAGAASAQAPTAAQIGDLNAPTRPTEASAVVATQSAPAAPLPSTTGFRYTMTAFTNASQSNMSVYDSADGTRYSLRRPLAYTPPAGLIRDPSVMKHTDGWYYVIYTTGWTGNTVGLARSRDMTDWEFVRNVTLDMRQTNTWAPEWFVDDDGSVHAIVSLSWTGTGGQFTPHIITASKDLTTWSAPKPLAGLAPNYIDTFVVKQGGVYHAFVKNETTKFLEHATSRSLGGPWTFDGTGNWAGWGDWVEGPALTQLPDGTWRIYFDAYRERKYYYSDSKDLKTWTPRVEMAALSGTVRHFTVLRERVDAPAAAAAVAKPAVAPKEVHKITWDKYSLMVDGERVFSWGGEFHPFRLPSPDLWRDILQKLKASGYNTVAIYVDWGYHQSKPGEIDFTGIRDMDRVFKMAKEEGLYVVVRSGPYVNAELTRGGFPGFLVNQTARARTDAPEYLAAVAEWQTAINGIIARNQLTTGQGTIIASQIENELDLTTPTHARYMQWLYDKARADGITVPIFHNDKGRNGYWVPASSKVPGTVPGPVDLYAFDGYPGGSCGIDAKPSRPGIAPDWGLYSPGGAKGGATASPNTPGFGAELGGGWFDYWGSNGGYECTAIHRGPGYQRVFYGTNIANGLTIQNFYMTYGGTSWGWTPAPVVFTSYDYGAAFNEQRGLRDKARVMKQMGMFINTVKDLTQMDRGDLVEPSNPRVKVYHNTNPRTRSHFYFIVHNPTSSTTDETFTFPIITPDGNYTASSRINGQDSKMLMAAYNMGAQRLVYSTSEIQTHLPWNGGDLALFYGRVGEPGETVLRYASAPTVQVLEGQVTHGFDAAKGDLKLNYNHSGLARVRISGGGRTPLLLLLADEPTGQTFWRQDTPAGATLQRGPQLIRRAAVSGSTLALTGDTETDSPLEVFAPKGVRTISWNGARMPAQATTSGSLLASRTIPGPATFAVPDLARTDWRRAAGSPESEPSFDDSAWQVVTNRPGGGNTPKPGGQPTLGMDAYGFHEGDVWYRGRYTSDGSLENLVLQYGGGGVGMMQVWIDGNFIGQHELPQAMPRPVGTAMVPFKIPAALRARGEHLISVMVRNNGHNWDLDADDFHKETRGLISASLASATGPNFAVPIAWKIQGRQGGENFTDIARGVPNNGGQFGERNGWHLPGFPDAQWDKAAVPEAKAHTGTVWYRTTFDLDAPKGHDVTMGISFGDPKVLRSAAEYRVLIFVNGWHMGQFIAHVGPQRTFMIPPGIMNLNGKNTLALAVTSDGKAGNALEDVKLVNVRTVRGGVPVQFVAAPGYKP